jgi:hypothetical protein
LASAAPDGGTSCSKRRGDGFPHAGQTKALMPVMLRPTIKVFISWVPS